MFIVYLQNIRQNNSFLVKAFLFMKIKLIYLSAILFTAFTITSCASRKYGCPNSAGMKVQTESPVRTAI
jgi:hypothetical protein